MLISLIAAASENNVIGANNKLIWKLADDTAFFMRTTLEHTVIMGRLTFDSMGKPLRNRRNIVISRKKNLFIPGIEVCNSLEAAISLASGLSEGISTFQPNGRNYEEETSKSEVFIIGGEKIYNLAIPFAQRIYLTRVHATVEGDAHFPLFDLNEWEEKSRREHLADERNQYAVSYIYYERRRQTI